MRHPHKNSERYCYHCGKRMFSQRRTKKYCSENCKQAAFYERNISSQKESVHPLGIARKNVSENPDNDNREQVSRFRPSKPYYEETPTEQERQTPSFHRPFVPEDKSGRVLENDEGEETFHQSKALIVSPVREEPYVWVYSKIITDITEYLEEHYNTTEMLQYPRRYWHDAELERILWVSSRLHSIVGELLLAGQKKHVHYRYLATIKSNCKAIISNINFRLLTGSYPFTGFIKELAGKIVTDNLKDSITIDFGISYQRKVELMAIRYQLATLTAFTPMNALNFTK